jgi:hypothetical protein
MDIGGSRFNMKNQKLGIFSLMILPALILSCASMLFAAPDPVTDIRASVGPKEGEIDLSWTYPAANTELPSGSTYYIQYSVSPGAAWNVVSAQLVLSTWSVNSGALQSLGIEGMSPGVTYYFRLWMSSRTVSDLSSVSNGATNWANIIAPSAVTSLAVTPIASGGSVKLSWIAPGDDGWANVLSAGKYRIDYSSFNKTWNYSSYKVEIDTDGVNPMAAQSWLIGGLTERATYFARIWTRDENPNNWSKISNAATGYSASVVPAAVTDLRAVKGPTEGMVKLSWTSPGNDNKTGAIPNGRYWVKCSTYSTQTFSTAFRSLVFSTSTSPGRVDAKIVTGLSSGLTYYFWLKTSDDKTANSWSGVSNKTTSWAQVDVSPPAVINSLVPSEVGFRHVKLRWNLPYGDNTSPPYSAGAYTGQYQIKYSSAEIKDLTLWGKATSCYLSGAGAITPGTQVIIDIPGLVDNRKYYFAVRTRDENNFWSDVFGSSSPSATPYNKAPGAPTVRKPVPKLILNANNYEFSWSSPTNAGAGDEAYGDFISSYTLYISTYAGPAQGTIGLSTFTFTAKTTYYRVTGTVLKENKYYWWKVKVYDSEEANFDSQFSSATRWVAVNAVNSPPNSFNLFHSSGIMSYPNANKKVYLNWSKPGDPDPGDFIRNYEVYWSTYSLVPYSKFSGSATVVSSSYTITSKLVENATCWWFAVACDSGTATPPPYDFKKTTSTAWAFQVNGVNESPKKFELVAPSSWSKTYPMHVVHSRTPELRWMAAVDPDPGDYIHHYTVRYASNPYANYSQINVVRQGGSIQTSTMTRTLVEDATYQWYVTATDNISGWPTGTALSTSSVASFFMVNASSQPPNAPLAVLIKPPLIVPYAPLTGLYPDFQWSSAKDRDPYDYVKYYKLYYSTDRNFNPGVTYFSSPLYVTTHTFTAPFKQRTTYYWNVRSYDSTGLYSVAAATHVFCFSNLPPGSFSVLSPTGNIIIANSRPTFLWSTSIDPPPSQTVKYTLLVSTVSDFKVSFISSSGITATSLVPQNDLQENAVFYWKVIATDGYDFIPSLSTGVFRVNSRSDPPDSFTLVSPGTNEVVHMSTPTLRWNSTTDPDPGGSIARYEAYYAPYGTPIQDFNLLPAGLATSTVTPALVENGNYEWYVKAFDNTGLSATTDSRRFTIDRINEPPDPFDLKTPSGPVTNTRRPVFSWENAARTEYWEPHTYNLYIGYGKYNFEQGFSTITALTVGGISGLYASLASDLNENSWYCWKVEAVDTKLPVHNSIFSNQVWDIYISATNEPPLDFSLVSPANGSRVLTRTPEFSWQQASDLDSVAGDYVTYKLVYSTSPDLSAYKYADNLSANSYQLPVTDKLLQGVTYYWKVIAKDTASNRTDSNTGRFFVTLQEKLKPPAYVSGQLFYSREYFTVIWSAVTEYEDGTPCNELGGYNVYESTVGAFSGFSLKQFVGVSRSSYSFEVNKKEYYYFVRSVTVTGSESGDSQAISSSSSPVIVTLSPDRSASLAYSLSLSGILESGGLEVSIDRSDNIYDIKVTKDGVEIRGYAFAEPMTLSFDHDSQAQGFSASAAAGYPAVFWNNGVEYVKLGGELSPVDGKLYVRVNRSGLYKVSQVTAQDDGGFSFNIVPRKIFTPNADGINDDIRFIYTNSTGEQVSGEIYDLTGAFVCRLAIRDDQGTYLAWDGKNGSGTYVRKGIYIYQIKCGSKYYNGTVVVVK